MVIALGAAGTATVLYGSAFTGSEMRRRLPARSRQVGYTKRDNLLKREKLTAHPLLTPTFYDRQMLKYQELRLDRLRQLQHEEEELSQARVAQSSDEQLLLILKDQYEGEKRRLRDPNKFQMLIENPEFSKEDRERFRLSRLFLVKKRLHTITGITRKVPKVERREISELITERIKQLGREKKRLEAPRPESMRPRLQNSEIGKSYPFLPAAIMKSNPGLGIELDQGDISPKASDAELDRMIDDAVAKESGHQAKVKAEYELAVTNNDVEAMSRIVKSRFRGVAGPGATCVTSEDVLLDTSKNGASKWSRQSLKKAWESLTPWQKTGGLGNTV